MKRSRSRKRVLIVLLLAALLSSACASTRVYEFVDPGFDNARYDGFLAYAAFEDLALEAAFERALCARLYAAGHACDTLLEAAPPTREQNAASRHAASLSSGAQATLVIELAAIDSTSRAAIAHGRTAYEVSVIDNEQQTVAARFAIEPGRGAARTVHARAKRVAAQIVAALEREALLFERD